LTYLLQIQTWIPKFRPVSEPQPVFMYRSAGQHLPTMYYAWNKEIREERAELVSCWVLCWPCISCFCQLSKRSTQRAHVTQYSIHVLCVDYYPFLSLNGAKTVRNWGQTWSALTYSTFITATNYQFVYPKRNNIHFMMFTLYKLIW